MIGITLKTLGWAFVGGVMPTFFWLWFWLRADVRPEPRGLLTLAFIAGALAVPLVIPLQSIAFEYLADSSVIHITTALLEELLKFLVIAVLVMVARRHVNEPTDYGVYLITGALGFAALENMLFLINPINDGNVALSLFAGNLRFLGATLLHAVTAAVIGISMGVAFYKPWYVRKFFAFLGIIAGTTLHALFNFFIIDASDAHIIATIGLLWVIGIFVLYIFRKLGQLYAPPQPVAINHSH